MEAKSIQIRTASKGGEELIAGTIYLSGNSITFKYAEEYLRSVESFDLAPSLPRSYAPFHFSSLGPFSDSAPDRWGRKVLARSLGRTRISEAEYLLGVNDLTRQGATRFYVEGAAVAGGEGVPIVANLPELLNVADAVELDKEIDNVALRRLYRATGSLGGARPKASVINQNALWLAKFPKPQGDDWDVMGWEAATLDTAASVGIQVPPHRAVGIKDMQKRDRTILLVKRFDRDTDVHGSQRRIPYISAMTALDASDGEGGDWLDLVEFTRSVGGDTVELWRRAVFGAVIGNFDDHLRNHGFLREGNAWILSPAFDMNPEPYDPFSPDAHELSLMGINEVGVGRMVESESLALFGVDRTWAFDWLVTLRSQILQIMGRARGLGIRGPSLQVMESRFAHAIADIDDARA